MIWYRITFVIMAYINVDEAEIKVGQTTDLLRTLVLSET
jgi:hypothetical protein